MKFVSSKILTLCLAALLLAGVNANAALVDMLGQAGKYAVLSLNGTDLNLSNVTVNGDVGVGPNGSVELMAPSTVNGTLFVDPTASIKAQAGNATGGIVPQNLSQAVADAIAASNTFAGMNPTQIFSSLSAATTINGNGGLNVIKVTGDITLGGGNLTLNGGANDQFVFNIYGGMNLGGSSSVILNGGITATNVVFNFVGAGSSLMTHVGNHVQGIVLAPQRDITFHGLFGEVIGGGKTLTLMSGATVTGFNVPEVTPTSVIFGFLGFVVAFGSRRTLMARVRPAKTSLS